MAWLCIQMACLALSGPPADSVLKRTDAFVRALPAKDTGYVLRDGKTGVAVGQGRLKADRSFETDHVGLGAGRAVALWTGLLRGGGKALLKEAGVDLSTTRLFHLHRRVVLIVGAGPGEPERPQVWLDRETGAPVRIIVGDDLTLRSYDAPRTDGFFPGGLDWRHDTVHVAGRLR